MQNPPPSFWQVLWSALCALFGVQSEHNRLRDFEGQRTWAYLVAGLLVTAAFITLVLLMVRFSLPE